MGVRRCSLVLVLLLLLPAQARAHLHKASARAGYSGVPGSLLSGFEISGELMQRKPKAMAGEIETRWYSYFLDFSANWGSHDDVDRRQLALVVGPRGTKYLGKSFELFAQVATGAVQTRDSPGMSDWAWGLGGGGGFALALVDRGGPKYSGRTWDLWVRAQYTYLRLSASDTDYRDYQRGSIGLEFRFGGRDK